MFEFARRLSSLVLAVFLLTGFTLAFVIPPFQVPDEDAHWISAVVRTETLFSGAQEFCSPAIGFPELFGAQRLAWHPEQKILSGRFEAAALAPPRCSQTAINYGNFLSYPGVLAAKVLLLGATGQPKYQLLQFYLSRLLHGLLVFWMLYRFRKLAFSGESNGIPGVLTVLGISLSPLFAQQSFGVSSDVTTNAFAISLATFLFHWKKVRALDWTAFALLGFSACSTKPTIIPALGAASVALAIYYRAELLAGAWRKNRKFAIFGALTAVLLAVGLWNALGHRYGQYGAASPTAQREFMLEHPTAALKAVFVTIYETIQPTPLFHPLGWMDTPLPSQSVNIWIGVFLLLLAVDLSLLWRGWERRNFLPDVVAVAGTLAGLTVSAFLMGYFLYLVWTPVGAARVDGLQGRYFFAHWVIFLAALFAAGRVHLRSDSGAPTHSIAKAAPLWIVAAVGAIGLIELFSVTKSLLAVAQRFW